MIIDIDVDGVVADMDSGYTEYVKHIIPNFNEFEHIKEWNYLNLLPEYKEAVDIMVSLYTSPEFIASLGRIENAEEGLKYLYMLTQSDGKLHGSKLRFHTHMFESGPLEEARRAWLEKLIADLNIDIEIIISVGASKATLEDTDIFIDDKAANLSNSKASGRFMIKRGHNQFKCLKDIGECEHSAICRDLLQCAREIEARYN